MWRYHAKWTPQWKAESGVRRRFVAMSIIRSYTKRSLTAPFYDIILSPTEPAVPPP